MDSTSEIIARAKELITTLLYVNLATASSVGMPWNSPVYVIWDKDLNCYWSSWIHAEHSKNIRDNRNVFITLYDSTRPRGTNNLQCLYMQGEAIELSEPSEISSASAMLYPGESIVPESSFLGDSVKRIYRFVPRAAWLNAKSEREVNADSVKMRVECPIGDLRHLFSAT